MRDSDLQEAKLMDFLLGDPTVYLLAKTTRMEIVADELKSGADCALMDVEID